MSSLEAGFVVWVAFILEEFPVEILQKKSHHKWVNKPGMFFWVLVGRTSKALKPSSLLQTFGQKTLNIGPISRSNRME